MANLRVTKRATCISAIRCIENGNTGFIYHDADDCKDNVSRWYRVFRVDGRRMAHSTRDRSKAAAWQEDFTEGLASGEFEAV